MSNRIKLSAVFIGGLTAALLVYVLLVGPRITQLAELHDLVRERKSELVTVEQQVLAYRNAQSDLSRAVRRDEIIGAFPEREGLVAAVIGLERGAAVTGTSHTLKINEITDEKLREQTAKVIDGLPGLKEIPYRLTTSNDYAGTVRFLQYLEHLPQFTEISKISLSADVVESELTRTRVYTGRVNGSIDGVFFIKPNP